MIECGIGDTCTAGIRPPKWWLQENEVEATRTPWKKIYHGHYKIVSAKLHLFHFRKPKS